MGSFSRTAARTCLSKILWNMIGPFVLWVWGISVGRIAAFLVGIAIALPLERWLSLQWYVATLLGATAMSWFAMPDIS
jgi:hypothetical protein